MPECVHDPDREAYGYAVTPNGDERTDEPYCPECLAKVIFYGSFNYNEGEPPTGSGLIPPEPYFVTDWERGWDYVKYDKDSPDLIVQRGHYDASRDGYVGISEPYLRGS